MYPTIQPERKAGRHMSHISRMISGSIVLVLAACGGGTGPYGGMSQSPPPPPPAGGTTVNASPSLAFTPATLSINAGQTVTFAFGSVGHNVTFDSPNAATPADIPGVNSNVNVDRTFSAAGTYRYHCTIHPVMVGSIVAQ